MYRKLSKDLTIYSSLLIEMEMFPALIRTTLYKTDTFKYMMLHNTMTEWLSQNIISQY